VTAVTDTSAAGEGASAHAATVPSPAVAPPPGNPRFALFDSLRGLAVLCIIAFHVASITNALARRVVGDALTVLGPQALIQFFVISGFLLYRPFVAARARAVPAPRLGRYARRRVLRIVPAYWVALTVLAIFPGLAGVFTGDWWRYYFFLQLYSEETAGKGIPVAWSLCVEVTFYALLPFWAMALRRLHLGSGPRAWLRAELVAVAIVMAGGIGVQVAAARNLVSDLLATTLLGQCVWLAVGMALAILSVAVDHTEREPRVVRAIVEHSGACWLGAGVAFVALTILLQPAGLLGIVQTLVTKQPVSKTVAAIALGIVMNALLVLPAIFGERAGGLPRRLLAAAPLAWFGVVSYGMYLWHLAITEVLGLESDPDHFSASGLGLATKIDHLTTPILYVLVVGVTAAFAAASYYVVELPFLQRKER
jgi:peptidoglycan/LPS O-acetylase OafA/YrhL